MIKNCTPLDIERVKEWSDNHADYIATHFLCLVPESPIIGSPFEANYREVNGSDHFPAHWNVHDRKTNGYRMATERYAIPNGGVYDPELLSH